MIEKHSKEDQNLNYFAAIAVPWTHYGNMLQQTKKRKYNQTERTILLWTYEE